jgi:nitroimidazol reductase NimA-like FMN-containing flavoprotein (pyridoxamine 5'-phosphate oxidase superfamily)
MLEIEEMTAQDSHLLLKEFDYGHLGCTREDGRPYVVPLHYTYDEPDIYIFTTEGMKTECLATNPEVCLQVEDVQDSAHWRSVILNGRAERLTKAEDKEHAMQIITRRNPTLTPAINKMWVDSWGRANVIAIYRIHPSAISGRKTI